RGSSMEGKNKVNKGWIVLIVLLAVIISMVWVTVFKLVLSNGEDSKVESSIDHEEIEEVIKKDEEEEDVDEKPLNKDVAEEENKDEDKQNEDSDNVNVNVAELEAKLEKRYDDMQDITWYSPSDSKTYETRRSDELFYFYPYVGDSGNNTWLRLVT